MTENKQYNYNYSIYSDRWIIKYKHKIIVSVSSEIEAKVIVDTLNRNCNVYKYQKELIKTLRKDINDFEKENNQLKQHQRTLEAKIVRLKDRVKTFEKNYSLKDIERYKKMENCNCITSKRLEE